MIGTVISHYRDIKRLGEGGMGEVFLAEDLKLRRKVALKMLRPDAAVDPEARARLFQEARAASVLNHPNVAVIYEVDETVTESGPLALIALEYVPGESVVDYVRRNGTGLDGALDLIGQIADGLGADDAFTRYYAACAYALQGNKEAALASLERAVLMRRDYTVSRARIEPELRGLKDEPAFRQLIG